MAEYASYTASAEEHTKLFTSNTTFRKDGKAKKESSTPFQITLSDLCSLMPFWGVLNRIKEKGWKSWPCEQKQSSQKRRRVHENQHRICCSPCATPSIIWLKDIPEHVPFSVCAEGVERGKAVSLSLGECVRVFRGEGVIWKSLAKAVHWKEGPH